MSKLSKANMTTIVNILLTLRSFQMGTNDGINMNVGIILFCNENNNQNTTRCCLKTYFFLNNLFYRSLQKYDIICYCIIVNYYNLLFVFNSNFYVKYLNICDPQTNTFTQNEAAVNHILRSWFIINYSMSFFLFLVPMHFLKIHVVYLCVLCLLQKNYSPPRGCFRFKNDYPRES